MGQIGGALQNVGSAFGNMNTFAPDPSQFSGSEWTARLLGGAGKGLLQGYSNMQQQNAQMRQGGGGGVGGGAVQQSPMIQPQIYDPTGGAQNQNPMLPTKPARNSLFYGYGSGQ